MDTMAAYAMAKAHKGQRFRVFDWIKAAALIETLKPEFVCAGLSNDWESTCDVIFKKGLPITEEFTCMYLMSNWAIPQIEIDGEIQPCWVWQPDRPEWNGRTRWPQEALDILIFGVDLSNVKLPDDFRRHIGG